MIKKRYITLGIIGIFLYGLFMYEPAINEDDIQKYMGIEVNDEKVDINIAEAVKINVDKENDQESSTIEITDAIKIENKGDQANVNLLGVDVGDDIENSDHLVDKNTNSDINKTEVSIKSNNPMVFRVGSTSEQKNQVLVDGIGIGELYELSGHDLLVSGIKNIIKIKGNCRHVTVDGIANVARVEGASSVTVNGIGNRVYVDGKIVSDSVSKSGILNFVFYD